MVKQRKDFRENIGEANINGVDMEKMQKKAKTFIKKHPLEYRKLTTYQYRKPGDLQKLYNLIEKENPDIKDKPDEIYAIMEEMFNISMHNEHSKVDKITDPKKKKEAIKRIVNQRLAWMEKKIYIPFFKEHPNYNEGFTPEELAAKYVHDIKIATFDNLAKIPVGTSIDVAVGTLNILGRRGFTIAHPDIKNHGFYKAKDYSFALDTGEPKIDYAIARHLREANSPLENLEGANLLKSPLAMKLMLMGTPGGIPVIAQALGQEKYKTLTEAYKKYPTVTIDTNSAAYKDFKDLLTKLRAAQSDPNAQLINIDGKIFKSLELQNSKGEKIIIAIRTKKLQSGVYERCFNASNIYSDEVISFSAQEHFNIEGNMRSYSAKTTVTLTTEYGTKSISFGLGATVPIGSNTHSGGGGEKPKGAGSGETGQGQKAPNSPGAKSQGSTNSSPKNR